MLRGPTPSPATRRLRLRPRRAGGEGPARRRAPLRRPWLGARRLSALWWQELLERRPELIHIDAPGKKTSRQDLRIRHPGRIIARTSIAEPPGGRPPQGAAARGRRPLPRRPSPGPGESRVQATSSHLPSLQAALGEGRAGTRSDPSRDGRPSTPARPLRERLRARLRPPLRAPSPSSSPSRTCGSAATAPTCSGQSSRLIVELDGKDAHHTPAQLQADAARQAHLEALGFTVIRFTWAEVTAEPEPVAATVREALSGPAPRRPPSRPPSAAPRRPSR